MVVLITQKKLLNMENQYIGARKIVGISDSDKKTPSGSKMIHVIFEDGSVKDMPQNRFDLVVTSEESDASAVGAKVRKQVGSMLYGLLHEYGVSLVEANTSLDEAATLINSAMDKATNILYGVEYPDDRTVLQINDILLEHAKSIADKDNNVTAPAGGTAN